MLAIIAAALAVQSTERLGSQFAIPSSYHARIEHRFQMTITEIYDEICGEGSALERRQTLGTGDFYSLVRFDYSKNEIEMVKAHHTPAGYEVEESVVRNRPLNSLLAEGFRKTGFTEIYNDFYKVEDGKELCKVLTLHLTSPVSKTRWLLSRTPTKFRMVGKEFGTQERSDDDSDYVIKDREVWRTTQRVALDNPNSMWRDVNIYFYVHRNSTIVDEIKLISRAQGRGMFFERIDIRFCPTGRRIRRPSREELKAMADALR